MLKRGVLVLVILLAAAGTVFAQSYTVQTVTGTVSREAGNSTVAVKAGDILSPDTVISTTTGSSLVVKDGDRTVRVLGSRKGKLSDLISAGLRISDNVGQVDTSAVSRTTGHVITASSRASDAAADNNISVEEHSITE